MANPYRNTGRAGSSSPANNIIGKAILKGIKAFGNTAKQYANKIFKPKEKDIRPLITGNKVYGRKEIDQAFKNRFSPEATITPKMPKIETRTMHTNMFGTKFIGKDVTSEMTNFNRPDAVVRMRNAMNKSGQYPKTDPWRGSPDLR